MKKTATHDLSIHTLLEGELEPRLGKVEVISSVQIPGIHIVGLANREIQEARERVRSAILTSDFDLPRRRLTVNLVPSSVPKYGTGFDLPIALALLAEAGIVRFRGDVLAWGELGLRGELHTTGSIGRCVIAGWIGNARLILLPEQPAGDLDQLIGDLASAFPRARQPDIVTARDLRETVAVLNSRSFPVARSPVHTQPRLPSKLYDRAPPVFSISKALARFLGASSAGLHSAVLFGPAGVGKSQALEWAIALQPTVTPGQRVWQRLLHDLSDTKREAVRRISPLVKPSTLAGSISEAGVVPGELSLAHEGLLVADEFLEWPRDSREILREPLERGLVSVSRFHRSVELPARFRFLGSSNLCPCGGTPPEWTPIEKQAICHCSEPKRTAYLQRFSLALSDRLDFVAVLKRPASADQVVDFQELRERTERTHERILKTCGVASAYLDGHILQPVIATAAQDDRVRRIFERVSLRGMHRLARMAITLAAWDETDLESSYFAEAFAMHSPEFFRVLPSHRDHHAVQEIFSKRSRTS